MPYQLLHQKLARDEVRWFKATYGGKFAAAWDKWMATLCDQAGKRIEFEDAADLESILDDFASGRVPSDLVDSWARLREAGWIVRVQALLAVVRTRRPPWQSRVLERHNLPGVNGMTRRVGIRVYLTVEHARQAVVVRLVEQVESD